MAETQSEPDPIELEKHLEEMERHTLPQGPPCPACSKPLPVAGLETLAHLARHVDVIQRRNPGIAPTCPVCLKPRLGMLRCPCCDAPRCPGCIRDHMKTCLWLLDKHTYHYFRKFAEKSA